MTTPSSRKESISQGTDKKAWDAPESRHDFALERYKYILQQIHTLNENVYRFLAIYQTLTTLIISAALALFVGYEGWGIAPNVARSGVIALIFLETLVAAFTALLIFVGILGWLDYRKEECELTDESVHPGFRKPPQIGNLFRWYETYVILFVVISAILMWIYTWIIILPNIE